MSTTRLFLIVFAAVLFGNLASFGAQTVFLKEWAGTVSTTFAAPDDGQPARIAVSFKNNAQNRLTCTLLPPGKDPLPFFTLLGGGETSFRNFIAGSRLSCSIDINDTHTATTMLTYLDVASPGAYGFALEKVPCTSCKGQNWRWATVFNDPQGHADYTHFQ